MAFVISYKPFKKSTKGKLALQLMRYLLLFILISIGLKSYSQCNASYTYSVDSITGSTQFVNTSVLLNIDSPVVYTWRNALGNVLSNLENPILNFGPGKHLLCLALTNAGCSDTTCDSIIIPERYCRSSFTYTIDTNTSIVQFRSTSIGTHIDHYWSFGDGVYSIFPIEQHQFTSNGWYFVCLNIVNFDSSCSDVKCEFVKINKANPTPCEAKFGYDYNTQNTKLVNFTNFTLADSAITSYWLFGDGDTSSIQNPSHTYSSIGNYTVCLLVSGPNCADSLCETVEILEILPNCNASFNVKLFADSGNNAKRIAIFNNTSISDSNSTYHWDLGDSSFSNEKNLVHYYALNGQYKVCLTTSVSTLCFDSSCQLLTITYENTGLNNVGSIHELKVFPNPASHYLIIEWQSNNVINSQLFVYNQLGVEVKHLNAKTMDGYNKMQIDTEDLQQGIYTLRIENSNEFKNIRFVK